MQPSKDDDFIPDDDFEPDKTDKGPEARRVQAGKAPGEKEYTDEQLGLDPGAVKEFPEDQRSLVNRALNAILPPPKNAATNFPSTGAEALEHNRLAGLGEAAKATSHLGGTVAGLLAATPALKASQEAAGAIGASPTLARILGGAGAGAGTAAAAGGTPKEVAVSAGAGGALAGLSSLMGYVVTNATASKATRELMRAGNDQVKALPMEDVINTVKKYGIENLKNPQVAEEALTSSIARASLRREAASKAMSMSASAGNPRGQLTKDAVTEFNEANKEVNILKALQPVAKKLAAAAQLKPTMMENINRGVKKVAPYAAGAGAYKLYKALSD